MPCQHIFTAGAFEGSPCGRPSVPGKSSCSVHVSVITVHSEIDNEDVSINLSRFLTEYPDCLLSLMYRDDFRTKDEKGRYPLQCRAWLLKKLEFRTFPPPSEWEQEHYNERNPDELDFKAMGFPMYHSMMIYPLIDMDTLGKDPIRSLEKMIGRTYKEVTVLDGREEELMNIIYGDTPTDVRLSLNDYLQALYDTPVYVIGGMSGRMTEESYAQMRDKAPYLLLETAREVGPGFYCHAITNDLYVYDGEHGCYDDDMSVEMNIPLPFLNASRNPLLNEFDIVAIDDKLADKLQVMVPKDDVCIVVHGGIKMAIIMDDPNPTKFRLGGPPPEGVFLRAVFSGDN